MDSFSDGWLITALIILILGSAFFSSSETGMVAINRYRLRHLARQGHRAAVRVQSLLRRTDRLLSVILIGNNFVNNFAATVAAILAIRWLGDSGAAVAPVVITLVMLVFAEITPKTYAALKPERIAFPASVVLKPLQVLLAPLVWLVNGISMMFLRLAGAQARNSDDDHLSPEELRTVVNEAGGLIPEKHQKMLLNILDLESVTVEDIMIPRNEMVGVDIDEAWDDGLASAVDLLGAGGHGAALVHGSDAIALNDDGGVLHHGVAVHGDTVELRRKRLGNGDVNVPTNQNTRKDLLERGVKFCVVLEL